MPVETATDQTATDQTATDQTATDQTATDQTVGASTAAAVAVEAARPPTGTVVVGVDGSPASRDALRWAAAQARRTGARLQVVMSWHLPTLAYGAAMPLPADLDLAADSRHVLDRLVRETVSGDPPLQVTATVVEGPAAERLLEAADGAELLVVGSRGHGELAGMLLGSVSTHCVAHATCPVVVVRPGTVEA